MAEPLIKSWWVSFRRRSSPVCIEALDADGAMATAKILMPSEEPATAEILPYPASPRMNPTPRGERQIIIPSFCYEPNRCKGRSSCPQRRSCTE